LGIQSKYHSIDVQNFKIPLHIEESETNIDVGVESDAKSSDSEFDEAETDSD
jgi:hypothetical protein